jgi:hypothetical protein
MNYLDAKLLDYGTFVLNFYSKRRFELHQTGSKRIDKTLKPEEAFLRKRGK